MLGSCSTCRAPTKLILSVWVKTVSFSCAAGKVVQFHRFVRSAHAQQPKEGTLRSSDRDMSQRGLLQESMEAACAGHLLSITAA